MPATTSIRIVIAPAGQAGQFAPPTPGLYPLQTIRLDQLPSADSPAFALSHPGSGEPRESLLSPARSARLAELLAGLPDHGLTAGPMSFDGIEVELIVLRADGPLVFRWQNDDWRRDPHNSLDEWQRVAALADFALSLAAAEGETT